MSLAPNGAAHVGSIERLSATCDAALRAQRAWAQQSAQDRMAALGNVRALIAARAEELARSAGGPFSEALAAQVLPLADACHFLEKRGTRILATQRLGARGRPAWMFGLESEIVREPVGVVLIIAPSNYPLLLPGVQVFQALAAGNAVLLKPAENGVPAAEALMELVKDAGISSALLTVLPTDEETARAALAWPINKVIFTGSSRVGREVIQAAARWPIPVVAELSGCDAVFIRADADVQLAARALVFGLRWNGSATCIAPRRIFVSRRLAERLEAELFAELETVAPVITDSATSARLGTLVAKATEEGASALIGGLDVNGALQLPCVLTGTTPSLEVMNADFFAPLLCIVVVDSDDEALELAGRCQLSLGASVFSRDEIAARALAMRVRAGNVTINDLIVPTADPRVPFGGRGGSGYGVTRGAEGLLEMTAVKVVQIRTGKVRPHFDKPHPDDGELFQAWIAAAHGGSFAGKFRGFLRVLRALAARRPTTKL